MLRKFKQLFIGDTDANLTLAQRDYDNNGTWDEHKGKNSGNKTHFGSLQSQSLHFSHLFCFITFSLQFKLSIIVIQLLKFI